MRAFLRPSVVLLVVAVLGLLWAGCGSEQDSPRPEVEVVTITARWATEGAQSLDGLLESNPLVFVATVEGQRVRAHSRGGPDEPAKSPVQVLDNLPISLFSVRVERSWSPDLSVGETVIVQQVGGMLNRSDGSHVEIRIDTDSPLSEGTTYLFFSQRSPSQPDHLVTWPFARLELDATAKFRPLEGWRDFGGVHELAGLGPNEIDGAIAASRAETEG